MLRWVLPLIERSLAARLVLALAALIGAVGTLIGVGVVAYSAYDDHFNRDERLEAKLQGLRANVTLDEFIDDFGRPRISTTDPEDGRTSQHIFGGDGYWIQAVVDAQRTVLMFAVTTCGGLHPRWEVWNGHSKYVPVVLGETRVANALPANSYEWFLSGATANTYLYGIYSGGNPTDYQTYAWGYNDACLDELPLSDDDFDKLASEEEAWAQSNDFNYPVTEASGEVLKVFSTIPINTFAVFGVSQDRSTIGAWQIGADRILTRTLDDSSLR